MWGYIFMFILFAGIGFAIKNVKAKGIYGAVVLIVGAILQIRWELLWHGAFENYVGTTMILAGIVTIVVAVVIAVQERE